MNEAMQDADQQTAMSPMLM